MTEAKWLACADPAPMLKFVDGKASDRRLRLFACACCRCIWQLLPPGPSREAVRVAEDYADRQAGDRVRQAAEERAEVVRAAAPAAYDREVDESTYAESDEVIAAGWTLLVAADAASAAKATTAASAADAARGASKKAGEAEAWSVQADLWSAGIGRRAGDWPFAEPARQAELARDIFGNPFRSPALDPAWRVWNGGTVPMLARGIYEERAFDRLPILADALEEAGCTDGGILGHCRGPGPHVRGCWVVDLILGMA
jgi:hypothetical protein